jgi:hypothetical protein
MVESIHLATLSATRLRTVIAPQGSGASNVGGIVGSGTAHCSSCIAFHT